MATKTAVEEETGKETETAIEELETRVTEMVRTASGGGDERMTTSIVTEKGATVIEPTSGEAITRTTTIADGVEARASRLRKFCQTQKLERVLKNDLVQPQSYFGFPFQMHYVIPNIPFHKSRNFPPDEDHPPMPACQQQQQQQQ